MLPPHRLAAANGELMASNESLQAKRRMALLLHAQVQQLSRQLAKLKEAQDQEPESPVAKTQRGRPPRAAGKAAAAAATPTSRRKPAATGWPDAALSPDRHLSASGTKRKPASSTPDPATSPDRSLQAGGAPSSHQRTPASAGPEPATSRPSTTARNLFPPPLDRDGVRAGSRLLAFLNAPVAPGTPPTSPEKHPTRDAASSQARPTSAAAEAAELEILLL